MKRAIRAVCGLFAVLFTVALLALPMTVSAAKKKANTSKKYATEITAEGITGSIKKEDQKRWYTFTTEKKGDAIIVFNNTADGVYTYYWYMTVLESDGETSIKEGNVEGDGKTTNITLTTLEAGTYYICMARAAGGNPFMNGYTDAEYTINLITADTPRGEVTGEKVFMLQEKGEFLCSLGGRIYMKENDGIAMVAYYTDESGHTCPILVGETSDAVKYVSTGSSEKEFEVESLEYDDKIYYYSLPWCSMPGAFTDSLSPALYKCSDGQKISAEVAAWETLNVWFGKDPTEGFKKAQILGFIEKWWFWLAVGAIIVIVIIVNVVKGIIEGFSSKSSYTYPSYTSSSSGSDYGGSSSGGYVWTDDDDMDLAKKVSATINDPRYDVAGYPIDDPEAPVTSIDDFPPSDSIW